MTKLSRMKGADGEREVSRLLTEELGELVQRKLGAARNGGSDIAVPGWAIEVKRTEVWLAEFWDQAERQAKHEHAKPALIWRKSRCPWLVWIDLHDIAPEMFVRGESIARITFKAFCKIVREVA